MIFWKLLLPSSNPTIKTKTATANPAIYSYRLWPYGCSLSAFFAAILNPIKAMIDPPASSKLFNPSATIDKLPDNKPTVTFPITKNELNIIHTQLARAPMEVLVAGAFVFYNLLQIFVITIVSYYFLNLLFLNL